MDGKDKSLGAETDALSRWLPAAVGALLCALVAVLWWNLSWRENAHLRKLLDSEAQYLASQVEADLRERVSALQRVSLRWELAGGLTEYEFLSDAGACLADFPGLKDVQRVDRDFGVRWAVPRLGSGGTPETRNAFDREQRAALKQAMSSRSPIATGVVDLAQGEKGFLVFFPTFARGEFDGFLAGIIQFRPWLEYILHEGKHLHIDDDFRISVRMDGTEVLRQPEWDAPREPVLEGSGNFTILGRNVSIHLRPKAAFLAVGRTRIPEMAAAGGAILSFLAAFIVHLLQKSLSRNRQVEAARAELERESRGHSETADRLRHALSRLELATRAGGFGIWSWDLSDGSMTWNHRMYELYGVPPEVAPTREILVGAIHPEDVEPVESLMQSALKGTAEFNTEYRVVLPTGAVRYLRAAAQVESDPDGRPLRVTGVDWDTTRRKTAELALKESEEKFRMLSQSTPAAILLYQNDRWIYANPAAERISGYESRELLAMNFWDIVHPDYRERVKEIGRRRQQVELGVKEYEIKILAKDGAEKWIELSSASTHVNGRPAGIVSMTDFTARKLAEEALAGERQRLAYILEGTNAGTWEWNVQTGEVVINRRWAELLGYTLEELTPATLESLMKLCHPDELEASRELLDMHFRKELPYFTCETRMRHKDGSWVWVLARGKVVAWTDDGKPLRMCGTHQDITESKLAEERIQHMATHDGLTDLPSLRLANDRLTMALAMSRRQKREGAVLFLDLDGFKGVNDTLGHDAGDFVLKEVGRRMQKCVRETDTVARIGGDEFLIVAYGLNVPSDAVTIAEKILKTVSRPILYKGREAAVGASIGIATFPTHGYDRERLLKLADEAMYQVKASGKNGYRFARLVRPAGAAAEALEQAK